MVRKRAGRKRALGLRAPLPVPDRPNACWSLDFFHDQMMDGRRHLLTQRLIDIMQALPLLVMALLMAAWLGPSLSNTIVAISIPIIPHVARVIRSNTLALREMPYV